MIKKGKIIAVCTSNKRIEPKKQIPKGIVLKDFGFKGDSHAGRDHKQVSLLGLESLQKNRSEGYHLEYGDLCENLVIDGIKLDSFPIGTKIKIGKEAVLEITQIGKDHDVFFKRRGSIINSILPKEGVFARVFTGGEIKPGDILKIMDD
jgi:MOSC domain-containing protein YiiM